jgi:hypothetical protein
MSDEIMAKTFSSLSVNKRSARLLGFGSTLTVQDYFFIGAQGFDAPA